ncbi:hypothetical protein [Myroides marinus]|uniref:hypothetical protein n=1 Tax=Myroides marinus TaxID=703342 RepID=UPI0025758B80|nr:hypothetical protein [Myroides marinus]MDM1531335.1 hypothetical protein [Myroides marinus]MDM1538517.1 hypothetical protein [Myroides marinus]
MKKILSALLLLCTLSISAQDTVDKYFKKYVPKGYVLQETIKGDLNKDGVEDCVLIIKGTDKHMLLPNQWETEIVDKNRRGIIVLFKKGNEYEVASKNYSCFSSENEDGGVYYAPELYLIIENNKLYIHYAHGRYGYWKYTLRYQNNDFEIIGYDSSYNRGPITISETSINFSTKKQLYRENINAESGNDDDEKFVETWTTINISSLLKLSKIPDFDDISFGE